MYALGRSADDPKKPAGTHRRTKIELAQEWQEFVLDDLTIPPSDNCAWLRPGADAKGDIV